MKSTYNKVHSYSKIIANIVDACEFETFLELGVDTGYTTKNVLDIATNIKKVYCVDLRSDNIIIHKSDRYDIIDYHFNTSTDEFFNKKIVNQIDCVFVDADHSYEQSRIDFINSFNILIDDGIIFLHDTYPPNEMMTSPDRNGDTYKLYVELSGPEWNDKIDIINLPIYDGLTIIRKRISKKVFTL